MTGTKAIDRFNKQKKGSEFAALRLQHTDRGLLRAGRWRVFTPQTIKQRSVVNGVQSAIIANDSAVVLQIYRRVGVSLLTTFENPERYIDLSLIHI